ncbi:MAG: YerC/YecD family TrpR-related protein [Tepidibacter sp.]|uniref:YerC/YecD family TrpR-related protein n=1 Tax=Tepidibacter sp. TaxID=2529387 RepID=UPI0025F72181|nr:YerC/YecD family TrpR-related protein [Tepidibacter sp.]MCT4508008.1 YerC/YecD family TrpR-related protein [Tepidibacter sp.]
MNYKSKLKEKNIDDLFEIILKINTIEECYMFFEDICTVKELKSLSQRLQVAKMLRNNKTYTEIEENTGASTATISRVSRCLNYGANGYNMMLDRTQKK